MEEMLKQLDEYNMKDYACYDLLKKILKKRPYHIIFKDGIKKADIKAMPGIILQHLEKYLGTEEFERIFKSGENYQQDVKTAKKIAKVLEGDYTLCGGFAPVHKSVDETKGGLRAWIEYGEYIIDPSLMIMISSKYKRILGYSKLFDYSKQKEREHVRKRKNQG